jgi:hypothetical protein
MREKPKEMLLGIYEKKETYCPEILNLVGILDLKVSIFPNKPANPMKLENF